MSTPALWFEADRRRLVAEVEGVRKDFPDFKLLLKDGLLTWEGETADIPPGIQFVPMRMRLIYPAGFPAAPIRVFPLQSEIPAEAWGHKWHRWEDGAVCIGHPEDWDMSYTASDVIGKVGDWYFNFVALLYELISEMPDVGRAVIETNSGKGNQATVVQTTEHEALS